MFLSSPVAPRVVVGAIGAGAVTGTLLWVTAGTAAADPPPRPANCTAADVAGVSAGVAAAVSAYLFTHPDVNGFFTDLQGRRGMRCAKTCRTSSTPIPKCKPTFRAFVSR